MTFSYTPEYNSLILRGRDEPLSPRPWDLKNEILKYAGPEKKLLDIGCGTGFKLLPLFLHFEEVTGLDISPEMIETAIALIKEHRYTNATFICGDSSKLPFEDKYFDIVTCSLTRWDINEIARVLKPDGTALVEHIGCEDKKSLKMVFGKDEHGWRGQFLDFNRDEYLQSYHDMFDKFFSTVNITNGFWYTWYSRQGVEELLKFTPTIRNFNIKSDAHLLQRVFDIFNDKDEIKLTQNRILIRAENIQNP